MSVEIAYGSDPCSSVVILRAVLPEYGRYERINTRQKEMSATL
jgi:hypothetical protein